MTQTLNLVENLLYQGRNLHKLGVQERALDVLRRLVHFRNLPSKVARETRLRLAELYSRRRRFKQARRQAAVVLHRQPNQPRYQALLGKLSKADIYCDSQRAMDHFHNALRQDPRNVRYLTAFGIICCQQGRPGMALKSMRLAYRIQPEAPIVLRRYIKVLQQLRRLAEAKNILDSVYFRLAKKPWFQKLRSDFQFFVLHHRQKSQSKEVQEEFAEEEPCLLTFPSAKLRLISAAEESFVRKDSPHQLGGPKQFSPRPRPESQEPGN